MKNAILQSPNGKWFFKLYDEAGSVFFNSGELFDSQMEAFTACQEKIGGEEIEVEDEAPKKTRSKK